MREIKFKALRAYDKKWIYGNLIQDKYGNKYIVPLDYFELDGHHLRCDSDEPCFVIENTISEYTGFEDMNGREIYEADVLDSDENYWKIRIEFCNGMKVLDFDTVRYNNRILNRNIYDFDFSGWEIVGNIHNILGNNQIKK